MEKQINFNGFKSQEQFEKTKDLVGNLITELIENYSDFELDSYDVFRLTDDEGLNAMSIVFTANIGYEKPNWVSFNIEIHSNGYMRVLTHKSVKEIPFAIVCIISSIWTIVGNDVFADVFEKDFNIEAYKNYLSNGTFDCIKNNFSNDKKSIKINKSDFYEIWRKWFDGELQDLRKCPYYQGEKFYKLVAECTNTQFIKEGNQYVYYERQ